MQFTFINCIIGVDKQIEEVFMIILTREFLAERRDKTNVEIFEETGIPATTVSRWRKKYGLQGKKYRQNKEVDLELVKKLVAEGKSRIEIATQLDIAPSTLGHRLNDLGLSTEGKLGRRREAEFLTEEIMRCLYLVKQMSEHEIANLYGIDRGIVTRRRNEWEIEPVTKEERLNLPGLTKEQKEVVLGTLLGDGNISPRSKTGARFTLAHSVKQKEYLESKMNYLKPVYWRGEIRGPYTTSEHYVNDRNLGGYDFYSVNTVTCSEFMGIYKWFYPDGIKIIPYGLELTPKMLALWFQDDGAMASHFGGARITLGNFDVESCMRAEEIVSKSKSFKFIS